MKNQRKTMYVMSFLIFISIFIIACNSDDEIEKLSNQIDELQTENSHLNNRISDLESRISKLRENNDALTVNNMQLKRDVEELQLNENEIKFDLRIPLDVFEVIQNFFSAVNTNDVTKVENTVIDKDSYAYQVAMQNIKTGEGMILKELSYNFEQTYEAATKTTKSIVVLVGYNNKLNSFVLHNTNEKGWKIVDID